MKLNFVSSWSTVKLSDALDYVIGGDWGKDENFEDPAYDFAYCIRGSEIKNWEEEKGSTASLRKIKINNIEKRKLIVGDILVEISGGGPEQPVGRTILIDKVALKRNSEIPKICTNFLRLMRPKKEFDSKFLNLYLKLFYYSGEIVKYQGGSNNLRNLKFPDFVKIIVPLPPLKAQQAIVSKIEELFSELDKGIENLKTAQQQLKIYRQAVLKWAFEGKLTNKKVKEGELPKGWKWIKLGDIATKITDGEHITPRRVAEGVLLLSARNIHNGYLKFKNVDYIPEDEYQRIIKRCNPEFGDILISCSGSVGRICIVPANIKFTMVRSVALVKLNSKIHNSKYFEFLLLSPLLQKQIEKGKKATAQANLFLGPIKNLDVIFCSIEQQNKIVQEIESRLSVSDKMEESISQSLQQAEALRQSILKKAFEGKLI